MALIICGTINNSRLLVETVTVLSSPERGVGGRVAGGAVVAVVGRRRRARGGGAVLQAAGVHVVQLARQHLQARQRARAVRRVDVREAHARALDLRERAERQLEEALEPHDVHLAAQVLGEVAVDAERDVAVGAAEGARVERRGGAERGGHGHLVVVRAGALVLLQVAARAEAHGARAAAEGPLHVVDVEVQAQLRRLRERLVAEVAHAPPVLHEPARRVRPHVVELLALGHLERDAAGPDHHLPRHGVVVHDWHFHAYVFSFSFIILTFGWCVSWYFGIGLTRKLSLWLCIFGVRVNS